MHEKSVELLNLAVADELAAVHQYMYFHFRCDDRGYDLPASLFKQTAIEEMMHVERVAGMEERSAKDRDTRAAECGANADATGKRLFEDPVADEERHYDQYPTEMENMEEFGDRHPALQSIERSETVSARPGPAA